MLTLAALCAAGSAQALGLGQTDSFSAGRMDGWASGAGHPVPPQVVTDGGPDGSGDGWLQLTALGPPLAAGSRLVAFAGSQWLGNYLDAGVTGITMDLRNLGATDLSLRLSFFSAQAPAYTQAVDLPSGGGWTSVHFSLRPADMIGPAALALQAPFQVRLIHHPNLQFALPEVAAVLGVDNVTAVPEPATGALLGLGVAALAALRRRRG